MKKVVSLIMAMIVFMVPTTDSVAEKGLDKNLVEVLYSEEKVTDINKILELAGNKPIKEEIVELKNDNGETKKFIMQQYKHNQLLSTKLDRSTGIIEDEYVTTTVGLFRAFSGGGTVYDDPWDSTGSYQFYMEMGYTNSTSGSIELKKLDYVEADILYASGDTSLVSSSLDIRQGTNGLAVGSTVQRRAVVTPKYYSYTYTPSWPSCREDAWFYMGAEWNYSLRHGSGTPWNGSFLVGFTRLGGW